MLSDKDIVRKTSEVLRKALSEREAGAFTLFLGNRVNLFPLTTHRGFKYTAWCLDVDHVTL